MECSHISELGYGEFSQNLQRKVAGQRLPIRGSMELSFRCNLKCQHCYVTHCQPDYADQKELTYSEIQYIVDQMVEGGCLWLLLTGGEPLIRRDFPDIYLYIKRKGFLPTIFTNGTLITPRIADILAEWKPFSIEISLYGRTQETYERITGIPGSFARCIRGIELLMERGLPLRLKTVLITLNQHELWDIQKYAKSLNVPFRFDPMINAQINGSHRPHNFRLSPEEVVQYDLADPERYSGWVDAFELYRDFQADSRYLYSCGGGKNSFHIDPYGNLSSCMMARAQTFNLRTGSFHTGWGEFLNEICHQAPQGEYPCQGCKLQPICGQCPGWGELEHGNPQQRVDYMCQVAHLRAKRILSSEHTL